MSSDTVKSQPSESFRKTPGRRMAHLIRDHYGVFCISVFFVIYVIYWSTVSIYREMSLHALVWDLGAEKEAMWLIYNTHWSIQGLAKEFMERGIIFMVFPLALTNGFSLMLIVQTIFLALPVFPLYGISQHFMGNRRISLFISSSYLIYFPLAGVNWYDFHLQVFFIALFLSGYYFYLREKYYLSIVLLLLSGLVRFPYIIYPLLLSTGISLSHMLNHFRGENRDHLKAVIRYASFSIFLLILSVLSFYLLGSVGYVNNAAHASSEIPLITLFASNLNTKIYTAMLLFFPLLGLPLISKKWIIFYLPFLYLLFFSGSIVYYFPVIFRDQYSVAMIPFVYLGLIDAISQSENSSNIEEKEKVSTARHNVFIRNNGRSRTKLSFAVLVMVILMGTVFLPYSPLHQYTNPGYSFKEDTAMNLTIYNELETIIGMIPANSSSVIIQGNLPQAYPRPLLYGKIFTPGVSYPYNSTIQTSNGQWIKLKPQYVLADPLYGQSGQFFATGQYPNNVSMFQLTNTLYNNGYGLLAEASGIFLLERNYSGPMKYFVPINSYYSATDMSVGSYAFTENDTISTLYGANANGVGDQAWYGPWAVLPPGSYNVTYHLKSTSVSRNNTIDLIISANSGGYTIAFETLNGTVFNNGPYENVTLHISLHSTMNKVEFRGDDPNWNGTLSLLGVSLTQVSKD